MEGAGVVHGCVEAVVGLWTVLGRGVVGRAQQAVGASHVAMVDHQQACCAMRQPARSHMSAQPAAAPVPPPCRKVMPSGSSSLAMVPGSSVLKMLPNSRFTVAQMALSASFLCWSRSWMTCRGGRREGEGVYCWGEQAGPGWPAGRWVGGEGGQGGVGGLVPGGGRAGRRKGLVPGGGAGPGGAE